MVRARPLRERESARVQEKTRREPLHPFGIVPQTQKRGERIRAQESKCHYVMNGSGTGAERV